MKGCAQKERIIEERMYSTFYGPWYYFTVDDGQLDLEKQDYLLIGTLESYRAVKRFVGKEKNRAHLY